MFDEGHVYPIHFSHEMEDEMQMLFEGSPIGRIYWLVKSIDLGRKTQAKAHHYQEEEHVSLCT